MLFTHQIDQNLIYNIELIIDMDLQEKSEAELLNMIYSSVNKIKGMNGPQETEILGQNRAMLIRELEDLFIYFVVLQFQFINNYGKDDLNTTQMNFHVPIKLKLNKYVVHGQLKLKDFPKESYYNRIFDSLILNNLKIFLENYKLIIKDQNISLEKIKQLLLELDKTLYNILVIRHNVENCAIAHW